MIEGGSGSGEAAARAHEQAGADGAADRDHLHLPGFQALVVALVLGVKRRLGGMGMRGNGVVGDGGLLLGRLFLGAGSFGISHEGPSGFEGALFAQVGQALRAEEVGELLGGEQPVFEYEFRDALAGGEGFLRDGRGRGVAQVRVECGDEAD